MATPNVVGPTRPPSARSLSAGLILNVALAPSATVPPFGHQPVASGRHSGDDGLAAHDTARRRRGYRRHRRLRDGVSSRTTPPFSTTARSGAAGVVASDGQATGNRERAGAGLSWTLVRRANTQFGTAEIWTATAAEQLTDVTVTSTPTFNSTTSRQSLTVVAFAGASGVGATASGGGNNTVPSVTLTTTRAGSVVYGVGNDAERDIARTLGANQSMVHQWVDSAGRLTFWVQSRNGTVATAGSSVTINDTAPGNSLWNLAAVEIIPR